MSLNHCLLLFVREKEMPVDGSVRCSADRGFVVTRLVGFSAGVTSILS
jgi:hypothetical protein